MNVLLVDDHTLFREGLALLLRPLTEGALVHEAGSCEEAKQALQAHADIGLVLMDLGLPGMPGLDGIAWLHETHPDVPVVALSSADDRETVLRALEAGAMGFIPKSSSSAVMMGALRLVLARGIYLPPGAFLTAPRQAPQPAAFTSTGPSASGPSDRRSPSPTDLGLTPRQVDVLDGLLQGKPAKLICRDLGLAPGTVKAHTTAVLRALNVTTRAQAVVAASQLGWRLKAAQAAR